MMGFVILLKEMYAYRRRIDGVVIIGEENKFKTKVVNQRQFAYFYEWREVKLWSDGDRVEQKAGGGREQGSGIIIHHLYAL